MRIIEPKVELWRQEDAKAHVARCLEFVMEKKQVMMKLLLKD